MRLTSQRPIIRPRQIMALLSIIVSVSACDGSSSSRTAGDSASDAMGYMDGSSMREAGPNADLGAFDDGSVAMDRGASVDAAGAGDASQNDIGAADGRVDSGVEHCRHTCRSDDNCAPSEECVSVRRADCEADFRTCVDRCENRLYRAPIDLRCCAGEMATAPVCAEGTWGCPEGSGQFETIPDGCGPGTNIPEEGVYCGPGAQPDLCDIDQFCCVYVVAQCTANQDARCYFRQGCDGPEDCSGGDVCCAFRSDSPRPRYASACREVGDCVGENEVITCNTPADCPPTQSCCAEAMGGIRTAICRLNCLVGP